MTTLPATSRIPVAAVALAGAGAQLVDDAVFLVLPPFAVLAPLSGLLAIALTAGAARLATRKLAGAAVARTGLAVGAVSAGLGLLVGGWGLIAVVLATLTVLAGVVGAVAGRDVP